MRLFTAIDIPEEVLANFEQLIAKLKPTARIKWIPSGHLHITTKFIGDWPGERLEELVRALESVHAPSEIGISIRGLGWFPNPRSPRVLWAGIEADPGLAALAEVTDEATCRLGVAKERRRFSPHLTLARIKSPEHLDALRAAINGLGLTELGSFTATAFVLYESELRPTGSVYTRRATFPLNGVR